MGEVRLGMTAIEVENEDLNSHGVGKGEFGPSLFSRIVKRRYAFESCYSVQPLSCWHISWLADVRPAVSFLPSHKIDKLYLDVPSIRKTSQ